MTKKTVHTIDDIARLAQVSKSTVSRALNDSPLLNGETRARIQAIARAHHFRVNASARSLSLRQSHTVAFVAPAYAPGSFSGEDLFGLEVLGGIGNALHALGYDLLVVHPDPLDQAWPRDYLDSGRVDGFILMTSAHAPEQIRYLVGMKAPFIAWGVPIPGEAYCSVTGDNVNGGLLATRHLLVTGRRRIAFLGGPEKTQTAQHRLKGYINALRESGASLDPELLAFGDYSFASGAAAMLRLLDQAPDLDAVFVSSDLMAVAAIQSLQNSGRRVPEDVAVVGYDDLPFAAYNSLPLTTIRQNIPMLSSMLAGNLIRHIQTGGITNVTTPVELVIRNSA